MGTGPFWKEADGSSLTFRQAKIASQSKFSPLLSCWFIYKVIDDFLQSRVGFEMILALKEITIVRVTFYTVGLFLLLRN